MQHAGVLLRQFRKARGWSQTYLQIATGIHYTVTSEIENGNRLLNGDHLAAIKSIDDGFTTEQLQELGRQAAIDHMVDEFGEGISEYFEAPLEFEVIERIVREIQKQKQEGYTPIATGLLPEVIEGLQDLQNSRPAYRRQTDRLIAIAAGDLINAFLDTVPEHQILGITWPYVELYDEGEYALKDRDEDRENYEMGRLIGPEILYVANELELSRKLLRARLKQVNTSFPIMQCVRMPLVATAISAYEGKMPKEKALRRFQKEVDILDSSRCETRRQANCPLGFAINLNN